MPVSLIELEILVEVPVACFLVVDTRKELPEHMVLPVNVVAS